MPNLDQAYEALRKADASGNAEDARKIASFIRAEQAKTSTPTEGVEPVAVHPAEGIADAFKSARGWFSTNEPEETSLGQVGGALAGGGAAGAIGGAVLPGALRAVGKVVPGVGGKLLTGLGEAAGALPLKERVIRGVGGGVAAGAVEEAGRAFGAPKALTLGASVLAGGAGESAASFLSKEGGSLAKFVGDLSYGNVAGASRALRGMLQPNKPLNEATARKLQSKLFGNPTEAYVDNLVGSENRQATQKALREADPSLNGPGPRQAPPRAPWEDSTGELTPMSSVKDLAIRTPGQGKPQPAGLLEAPAGALPGSFAAGKAGAAAKAAANREAQASEEAAANQLKPASAIYRERMFGGVTEAVKQGKTFSTTPEFAKFQEALQTQVTLGNVSAGEAKGLLKSLTADRLSKQPQVLDKYAETVDDRIRKWGKPAEGGGQTGAAAVDAKVATTVRQQLRDAYNGYTGRLGLGNVEEKYRQAYSQEMIAEAKDQLPHFLAGFGTGAEFQKLARNLSRDPEGKLFIQQALAKHLANQDPATVPGEFAKLQKVLVNAELLQPKDLKGLRDAARAVGETASEGLKLRRAQQMQRILLMSMTREAGVAAGRAAGGAASAESE